MRSLRLTGALVLVACGQTSGQVEAPFEITGETETRAAREGPVEAVVSVTPKEPKLGDAIRLVLTVTAEADVAVELPPFGEALGRFQVVNFKPAQGQDAEGRSVSEQIYTLQADMSGRQRIPSLRIEFVDRRQGREESELRELLTEEIDLDISSVLPPDALAEGLRGPRGALSETAGASLLRRFWPFLVLLIAGLAGGFLFRRIRQRRDRLTVELSHERALARLAKLERFTGGDAGVVNAYYVELSSIIRHYLEDRFRLRAPELTTEEFLSEARRSHKLTDEHRKLLAAFLAGCDRVKFSGHQPDVEESKQDRLVARQFVTDTAFSQQADSIVKEAG